MMKPIAFSPGSLTCFFQILDDPKGTKLSRGCSINIKEGVHTGVAESSATELIFNGEPIEMEAVSLLLAELCPHPVRVEMESPLPIGCGFGVSAACTFSAALAVNQVFDLGFDRLQLTKKAYRAEVLAGTGVGDVASQYHGGVVYRRCFDGPVDTVSVKMDEVKLFCTVFGPIQTKLVLGNPKVMAQVNQAGMRAVEGIKDMAKPLHDIFDLSLRFTRESGLMTPEVAMAIRQVEGQGAKGFMVMLGNSLLSTIPYVPSPRWGEGGRRSGEGEVLQAWATSVDEQGARLL